MNIVRGFPVFEWNPRTEEGCNVSSEAQKVLCEAYALVPVEGIYGTSGTRSDSGSFHDWASQIAIDVGGGGATTAGAARMRALIDQLIWPNRQHFAEVIFRDLRSGREFGIKWGAPLNFGDDTYSDHENHVHTAATLTGARRVLAYAKSKWGSTPVPKPIAPVYPRAALAILR